MPFPDIEATLKDRSSDYLGVTDAVDADGTPKDSHCFEFTNQAYATGCFP